MGSEMVTSFASKMGITSARITRQAEEYLRLSEVKCSTLNNITSTSKTVICLELAATSMKLSLDKENVIRLSGLTKKQYQSSQKAMEYLLGLDSSVGLRDMAVQYGCMDAAKLAAQILDRYGQSLPAAQQNDLDLSKALFTSAALYSACRCLKMKVDKKLASSSGVKKTVFDRLVVQLNSVGQSLCKAAAPSQGACKPSQKRHKTQVDVPVEKGDSPSSPKLKREDEERQPAAQDYEEWKRKILENAMKSTNAAE